MPPELEMIISNCCDPERFGFVVENLVKFINYDSNSVELVKVPELKDIFRNLELNDEIIDFINEWTIPKINFI